MDNTACFATQIKYSNFLVRVFKGFDLCSAFMSLQSFLQQNKKIYIYMYSETFSQYCCNNKNIYTCSNTSSPYTF